METGIQIVIKSVVISGIQQILYIYQYLRIITCLLAVCKI